MADKPLGQRMRAVIELIQGQSDEELMAIINAWADPDRSHVPGCHLDFVGYCLDCHSAAYNALQTMKARLDAS